MNLRPGIAEAVDIFWRLVDARVPPVVRTDEERATVNAALLVALAKIHTARDQEQKEHK